MKISCWMTLAVNILTVKDPNPRTALLLPGLIGQFKNSEHGSLFLFLLNIYSIRAKLGARPRVWALACVFMLCACQQRPEAQSVTFSGPIMGTEYRITVVVPVADALDQLELDILAEMNAVNSSMSTYLVDSELSQINRLPAYTPFVLSPELNSVLSEALEISELSQGAFDVTVADAVNLWGFGPNGTITAQPSPEQLVSLQASVGYKNLRLVNGSLSKVNAATKIDLSAIAKGYAVDQVARMLKAKRFNNFLIDVGGELRLSGLNVDKRVWRVAIEKPQTLGGVQQVLELTDAAIATSGDYRNFININGRKYSHTISPKTLKPVFHRLALVSVISENASTADALATALMAMGEAAALEFARDKDLIAYFVIRGDDEGSYKVSYTDKFARFLQ
ncbi:MAG: thiamine biosynthesis lipoprotein [Arenicella sp.]|jgi:thiamine biosynthesis lipoprotein